MRQTISCGIKTDESASSLCEMRAMLPTCHPAHHGWLADFSCLQTRSSSGCHREEVGMRYELVAARGVEGTNIPFGKPQSTPTGPALIPDGCSLRPGSWILPDSTTDNSRPHQLESLRFVAPQPLPPPSDFIRVRQIEFELPGPRGKGKKHRVAEEWGGKRNWI